MLSKLLFILFQVQWIEHTLLPSFSPLTHAGTTCAWAGSRLGPCYGSSIQKCPAQDLFPICGSKGLTRNVGSYEVFTGLSKSAVLAKATDSVLSILLCMTGQVKQENLNFISLAHHLCTALFRSPHRVLIVFRSALWLGYSKTLKPFCC